MSSIVAAAAPAAASRPSGRPLLSLLNAFELRCGGEVVELPHSAQRLLAFLALNDRPLQRIYVAGVLWAEVSDARASASLRSSLWRLRRPGLRLVDATLTRVRLAAEVDVDVRRVAEVARGLLSGSIDPRNVAAGAALDGELLPDWYDDWVLFERERLRQLGLHALEALAEGHLAAGRPARALEAALAAVSREPLRESAHRLLIRVHLAEGNAGEALRQYEACRALLRERLGLRPTPQLEELVTAIQAPA